jgi:hypothetical protein
MTSPLPPRLRRLSTVVIAVLGALLIAFLDLGARARSAYRRAERLERWSRFPGERDAALEAEYLKGVAALDRRRPSQAERDAVLEVLRKKQEEARARSAAGEAYHAWRDVYEVYAPPETGRTRLARLMAPADRQRWREEWTAKHLPFDDAFLDLETGEEDGYRWVYSTVDGREASQVLNKLQALEVPAKMLPPDKKRSKDAAVKILVPEERFWEAHEALRPLVDK